MKLKEEFVRLPKNLVYDMYISLVYKSSDYDNITRSKMLDSIIKEYNQKYYLYNICTERELKFLKYAKNKKIDDKDLEKYEWEIKELNKKCIFSKITFDVFEEQQKNVDEAIDYYDKHVKNKQDMDKVITFMISIIKINVEMLSKALISLISSMFNIDSKDVNSLFGNPLFHFYCEFTSQYFKATNGYEEFINYRENWDLTEELNQARIKYGNGGGRSFDIRDNYDIFYYGFPIRNKKVKKMYDEVSKIPIKDFIFSVINEARILNEREIIELYIRDEKLLKIINEALDEIPCAAMNGLTPNEYKMEKIKGEKLEKRFSRVSQNNAHLCKSAADEFYKLYFALLDYTNKKYNIEPSIEKIYKQERLDAQKLLPINNYLFENKNIIDDFILENPQKFSKEELDIIAGFKNSVTSELFIVVGFEREYTEILSEDGKIYMVKGIRDDLDNILDSRKLPIMISTTLLMFKDKIVYNSFLSEYAISIGNDMKLAILNDYEKAMRYYHL